MKVTIEINLVREPAVIAKLLKLADMQYVDARIFTREQWVKVMEFLRSFFDDASRPIKTFDDRVLSKSGIIVIGGSVYMQVIRENNESAWVWEPIDINHYFAICDLLRSPIDFVFEALKGMIVRHPWVVVNLYLFCLKHNLKFPDWITDIELINRMQERFASDVLARAYYHYQENFESRYVEEHWDHTPEQCIDDLLEEAREAYEESPEQIEDLNTAYREIEAEWLEYTGYPDPRVMLAFSKVREQLGIRPT